MFFSYVALFLLKSVVLLKYFVVFHIFKLLRITVFFFLYLFLYSLFFTIRSRTSSYSCTFKTLAFNCFFF